MRHEFRSRAHPFNLDPYDDYDDRPRGLGARAGLGAGGMPSFMSMGSTLRSEVSRGEQDEQDEAIELDIFPTYPTGDRDEPPA